MTENSPSIISKGVKDMYGTFMGNVIGTATDIDGTIQTVGLDCGSEGLRQIPYEQLVLQGDVLIFIPNWRIEAQRLLREKGLTIRRLTALMGIVSDNSEMKPDAELIHEKYKSKLISLDETEAKIKAKLATRLEELEEQEKAIKFFLFDVQIQANSNEISQTTFDDAQKLSNNMVDRINHEKSEINNIQKRIHDMSLESIEMIETKKDVIQQTAVSYMNSPCDVVLTHSMPESALPIAPQCEPENTLPEPPEDESESSTTSSETETETDSSGNVDPEDPDWLSRMQSQ
jgi:hypothetical protein